MNLFITTVRLWCCERSQTHWLRLSVRETWQLSPAYNPLVVVSLLTAHQSSSPAGPLPQQPSRSTGPAAQQVYWSSSPAGSLVQQASRSTSPAAQQVHCPSSPAGPLVQQPSRSTAPAAQQVHWSSRPAGPLVQQSSRCTAPAGQQELSAGSSEPQSGTCPQFSWATRHAPCSGPAADWPPWCGGWQERPAIGPVVTSAANWAPSPNRPQSVSSASEMLVSTYKLFIDWFKFQAVWRCPGIT